MGALLFNVSPLDPLTYAAGIVALGVVAVLATWLPARQATRVDPALAPRGGITGAGAMIVSWTPAASVTR